MIFRIKYKRKPFYLLYIICTSFHSNLFGTSFVLFSWIVLAWNAENASTESSSWYVMKGSTLKATILCVLQAIVRFPGNRYRSSKQSPARNRSKSWCWLYEENEETRPKQTARWLSANRRGWRCNTVNVLLERDTAVVRQSDDVLNRLCLFEFCGRTLLRNWVVIWSSGGKTT